MKVRLAQLANSGANAGDVPQWDGSQWVPAAPTSGGGGGGGTSMGTVRVSTGDQAITSTSYIAITGLVASVIAQAGDKLVIEPLLRVSNTATTLVLDAGTTVSGAAVNYVSSGTGTPTGGGVPAWTRQSSQSTYQQVTGGIPYTVQAADISGGAVTVQMYAKVFSGSRTVAASAGDPAFFRVHNTAR